MSYSGKVKGTVNSKASEKPAAVPMNVKAFIDGLSEQDRSCHRAAFLHVIQSMSGCDVTVETPKGKLGGSFFTATPFANRDFSVVIKNAKIENSAVRSTVILPDDSFTSIRADSIDIKANVNASDFKTDSAISLISDGSNKVRELTAIDDSWLAGSNESFEGKNIGQWNQFEANLKLFNVSSGYDENIYTKKLDYSQLSKEQIAMATRIATSIESSSSSNIHILEERGQLANSDFDEEDLYSGVIGDSSTGGSWRRGGGKSNQGSSKKGSSTNNSNASSPASSGKYSFKAKQGSTSVATSSSTTTTAGPAETGKWRSGSIPVAANSKADENTDSKIEASSPIDRNSPVDKALDIDTKTVEQTISTAVDSLPANTTNTVKVDAAPVQVSPSTAVPTSTPVEVSSAEVSSTPVTPTPAVSSASSTSASSSTPSSSSTSTSKPEEPAKKTSTLRATATEFVPYSMKNPMTAFIPPNGPPQTFTPMSMGMPMNMPMNMGHMSVPMTMPHPSHHSGMGYSMMPPPMPPHSTSLGFANALPVNNGMNFAMGPPPHYPGSTNTSATSSYGSEHSSSPGYGVSQPAGYSSMTASPSLGPLPSNVPSSSHAATSVSTSPGLNAVNPSSGPGQAMSFNTMSPPNGIPYGMNMSGMPMTLNGLPIGMNGMTMPMGMPGMAMMTPNGMMPMTGPANMMMGGYSAPHLSSMGNASGSNGSVPGMNNSNNNNNNGSGNPSSSPLLSSAPVMGSPPGTPLNSMTGNSASPYHTPSPGYTMHSPNGYPGNNNVNVHNGSNPSHNGGHHSPHGHGGHAGNRSYGHGGRGGGRGGRSPRTPNQNHNQNQSSPSTGSPAVHATDAPPSSM